MIVCWKHKTETLDIYKVPTHLIVCISHTEIQEGFITVLIYIAWFHSDTRISLQ